MMTRFEYKIVPAPKKGLKGKGIKGAEERFANALMLVMNDLGTQGWEYLRCDTLPSEVRSGLTGKTTAYQNMLVFRRKTTAAEETTTDLEPAGEAASNEATEDATDQSGDEDTGDNEAGQTDEDDSDQDEKAEKLAAE